MRASLVFAVAVSLAALSCSKSHHGEETPAPVSSADAAKAAVDAPDRSAEDRALDAGRHPAELLAFFGIRPGMRVAEIGAGGGYTTELLARAVGPNGKVFGINSPYVLQRFAEKPWTERLGKPVMRNVVRVDHAYEDPFPPEAKDLDAVVMVLVYHDMVWQMVDRAKMNAAIFAALKPGGVYGIVDHAAGKGRGKHDAESLHRIEEQTVIGEVTAAGFHLEREATLLRNPNDAHDWNDSPPAAGERRGTSDRFALVFVKPG